MFKTVRSNILYLLISLAGSSTSFLLIPLYISSFSVPQYGIYALMSSFLSFLTIFIALNLDSAVQTFFFDHHKDKLILQTYLKNVFTLALLVSTILLLLITLLGPGLFRWTFSNNAITFFPYGLIVAFNAWASAINQIYLVLLRNREDLKKYGVLVVTSSLLSLSLQFVFIYFLKLNVVGALLGALIPNILLLIYILSTNDFVARNLDFPTVKKSLKYSLWLLPFLFIQWFLARGDRFIIENFIGLDQVGVYALLMNISMILSIIATSILNSIRPTMYREFKKMKAHISTKVRQQFTYYLTIIAISSTAIYILLQNIHRFEIDTAYYTIQSLIGLALILFGIRILIRFFNEYLNYRKRSGMLSLLSLLNLIIFLYLTGINLDRLTLVFLLKTLITSNLAMLVGTAVLTLYLVANQVNDKS